MKIRLLKKVRRRYSIRLQQVYCKKTNTFSSEYAVYNGNFKMSIHHTYYMAVNTLILYVYQRYEWVVRPNKTVSTKVWWK